MPLNRYQIRNEYSLADPELYKAADKDDPEALLEGVAMAGLVGVLRQLGDLAEFAAEIFHDLHEEVMATAARGHSLTVRVQQLEAEFPLIERAFLSQTNHSSFFYNTGTDWHPNLRVDQSMVTQGDLPRFVMDSYEECRGPPRLFLLDKFDVAGAGACLKRYTDPSCFKVERSPYAFTSDVQRDKKARKTKKRGSRWRNGETPEVLHTSHAKLHQLFLEERIENGINVPAHRVKLKRKLNGFPFDPKTGKSYMNKFLEVTSPEYKVVHDKCIDSSSPLRLPSTNAYETLMDTEDVGPPSPDKQVMQRDKRASSSPPQVEETYALKPCLEEVNEVPSNDEVQEISRPRLQSIDTLPSTHSLVDEKEIQVDGERRVEASNDYESDDVASEVDTYVDALATMESELDTDSEQRAKRNLQFLNSRRQVFSLSSSSEKLQAPSSDSHSIENSTLSDDGNGYFKKEVSDFSCSDSPSASDGSALLESEMSSKETKTSGTSYDRQSVGEDTQLPQPPIHGDSDKKCITNTGLGSGSCDSGEETTTGMRAETNGKFAPLTSTAEDPENLHVSSPNAPEQNVDDSLSGASIEGQIADDLVYVKLRLEEDVSSASYPSDVPYRASGNLPWSKSPKIQQERKSDNDRVNLANNLSFTSELLDDPSHDIHELSSSVNQNSHNLDCEDPFLGEDSSCLYNLSDGPSSKEDDIIPPSFLAVNNPNHLDGFDNESSNGISDASVQGVDLSTSVKEHGEHSWLTISHDQSAEETCMTKPRGLINTELDAGDADEEHEEICGAFSAAVTSEQGDLNQNCGVDRPDFLGVLKPVISVTANDIWPLEPGKEEISCSIHENLVDALSTTAFEEKGDCAPSEVLSAPELIHSRHLESATKEAVLSDESENKRDKLDVTDGTASLATSAHKGDEDDLNSSLYQEKFPEDSICLIRRSSQNELELDQIHLPDSHAETKVEKPMADSPESNSSVHDISDSRHPQSEVLATSSDNELSFRAENTKDLDTASSLPPSIHCSLDTAQVPSERSVATEDPLDEENDELEDDQLNEELMDKAVVNVDQSPLMEQIEPPNHADLTFDATSESLLANLPREAAVPDVLAHSSNKDLQPLVTDYCTEEGAESAIYQDVKMEVLDRGEAMSEPQQVGSFDLEQASISLSTPSLSQPSFPELLSPSNEDNLSSLPTHLPNKEDNIAQKKLDKETLIEEGTAKMELDDAVGVFDESSRPSMEDVPSQSSVSNSFSVSNHNINPFEHENIMISTSPGFAGEGIDLAEMPPLPPLPPMQWIMTKTHSTSDLDRESTPHHIGADSLNLAPRTDQNSEPVATENTELVVMCSADNAAQSGQYYEAQQPSSHAVREEETQPVNSILDASSLDGPSIDAWGSSEELNQSQDQVAPELLSKGQGPTDCAGIKPKEPSLGRGPADASESFCHEPSQPQPKHQPLHHLAPETSLNRSNFEESTTSLERNVVTHDTVVLSPYTENDKSDHIIPTSDAENIWPSVEEANANEIRPVKLQRPRTPLIDDLASHDKSKLRKVTERVRPEIDKVDETDSILQLRKVVQRVRPEIENVDERDSLLEQIRKKSFNLKPTVATRPSIQGPQTNLRVAAILEKAKTIRQAFAGSDEEDDEDSWSDS